MKIRVQNLGVLKDGEVNLDRPLTVFTGPNNSGKTYMSNVIYGIYSQRFFENKSKYFANYIDELILNQSIEISTDEFFNNFAKEIGADFSSGIKKNLTQVFALPKDFFTKTKIDITISPLQLAQIPIPTHQKRERLNELTSFGQVVIYFQKNENGKSLKISFEIIESHLSATTSVLSQDYQNFIRSAIESVFIQRVRLACIYIVPERKGLELLASNFLIYQQNVILSNKFKKSAIKPLPLALNDNLYAIANRNWLVLAEQRANVFAKIAHEIENALLGGSIELHEDNNVYFSVKNEKPIPLHIASSSVKSLTAFILALKYEVSENYLLLIDEPEMNLHPRNQRILARYLAKLANAGLRLVVSTHSDYILHELNNMILLTTVPEKRAERKGEIMENWKIAEDMLLAPEKIRLYSFENGGIEEINWVKDEGFRIKPIEDTINDLQNETENLFYSLAD